MVEQSRDQRDTCIPFFAVRSVFFLYIYIFRIYSMMEAETLCIFKRTACCNVSIGKHVMKFIDCLDFGMKTDLSKGKGV